MTTVVLRARNLATEHCSICQVPAGTVCRSPKTGTNYATLLHDVPVTIAETEKQAIIDDHEAHFSQQGLLLQGLKRARVQTANATPTVILNEALPSINSTVLYVETKVGAAITPGLTAFKMWRQCAMLARTSGTWAVLGGGGGVLDMPVPPAAAGASSWAITPSLPGGDIIRITVTGQAATTIGWVASLELFLF